MPSITLKNIPDRVYRRLKESAAAHRRSLNSEILISLERSLASTRVDPKALLDRLDVFHRKAKIPQVTGGFIQAAKVRGRA